MRRPLARCVECQCALPEIETMKVSRIELRAYVFGQKLCLLVMIHKQPYVPTLIAQRLKASLVGVLPPDTAACCYLNLRFAVFAVIDVHPHDILARALVENNFRALDDAIETQVAA